VATHDYVISNGTGSAVRSDINGALAAIVSNNSGATEPATMYAYQWWADTTTGLLKIRNAANSAWVTIGTLASANLGLLPLAGGTMTGVLAVTAGTAALPGIAVSGDSNTGIYSPGADQIGIATGGTSRIVVDASGNVNIDSGTLYVDNTNNRVGIGTTSPGSLLDLRSASAPSLHISETGFTPDYRGYSIDLSRAQQTGGINFTASSPSAFLDLYAGGSASALGGWSGQIRFFTGGTNSYGTERACIDSSGRLLVGTSSGNANGGILQLTSGITFPATAVAASDANTLDDYEEGTWTPTQGGGLTVVGAYSSQGFYTKVGNKVYVTASLFGATSIASSTTGILCGGLPFTPAPPSNGFIAGSLSNQSGNISNTCLCVNTTNVYGAVAITATTGIHVTLTYRV